MSSFHYPAGQVESALDVDDLDALFASFVDDSYVSDPVDVPAGQAFITGFGIDDDGDDLRELFEDDSAGQSLGNQHPPTGGKTIESLVAAGLYVEDDDESNANSTTESIASDSDSNEVHLNDSSSDCTSNDDIFGNELDCSDSDSDEDRVDKQATPTYITPGAVSFLPEQLPFKYLDEEEKQSLIVGYINDHQDWFVQEIGGRQNLQEILQQFPLEIGAFLSENQSVLQTIRTKYPELLTGNAQNLEHIKDNQAALSQLLSNHANNNTLSAVFAKHPKILAYFLKSLDNSSVLFAFLSKHKPIVGKFLEQHKNIEVLAEFLSKYPAAMDSILDEEPSIIENFLQANPSALHVYLDAKSHILHEYLTAKPEKLENYLKTNPNILKHFLDQHPDILSSVLQTQTNTSTPISDPQPTHISKGKQKEPELQKQSQALSVRVPDEFEEAVDSPYEEILSPELDADTLPQGFLPGQPESSSTASERARQSIRSNEVLETIEQHDQDVLQQQHIESSDDEEEEDPVDRKGKGRASQKQTKKRGLGSSAVKKRSTTRAQSTQDAKSDYKKFFDGSDDDSDGVYKAEPARKTARKPSKAGTIKARKNDDSDYGSGKDNEDKPAKAKPKKQRTARSLPAVLASAGSKDVTVKALLSIRASLPYPAPAEAIEKDMLKKLGGHGWTLREEDCGIKHMLDVNEEKLIKGEGRFEEAVNRMNAELGVDRTKLAFKNFWNRAGRARSQLDERRCKSTILATSLQGKAYQDAVANMLSAIEAGNNTVPSQVDSSDVQTSTTSTAVDTPVAAVDTPVAANDTPATPLTSNERVTPERPSYSPITSPEVVSDQTARKRKSEEPEEEEFELGSHDLAFALGTRQKKRVKYTS